MKSLNHLNETQHDDPSELDRWEATVGSRSRSLYPSSGRPTSLTAWGDPWPDFLQRPSSGELAGLALSKQGQVAPP